MMPANLHRFFRPRHSDELIYEISAQISAELDPARLLRLIVERIKAALGFSYCAILLKEGHDLVIRAVTEHPEEIIGKKIPLGPGLSGRCALQRKGIPGPGPLRQRVLHPPGRQRLPLGTRRADHFP